MNALTAGFIYALGALTCAACTILLARGYFRTRVRLLMWCGFFFAGLTVDNIVLIFDLTIFPQLDLSLWRHGATLIGLAFLIFGLVWESE